MGVVSSSSGSGGGSSSSSGGGSSNSSSGSSGVHEIIVEHNILYFCTQCCQGSRWVSADDHQATGSGL